MPWKGRGPSDATTATSRAANASPTVWATSSAGTIEPTSSVTPGWSPASQDNGKGRGPSLRRSTDGCGTSCSCSTSTTWPPCGTWRATRAHQFALQVVAIKDRAPIRYDPDPYGRVHTVLTNLPSDLRQYLRLDGSPLVNLDIANSQPMFLGLVLHAASTLKDPTGEENDVTDPEKRKLLELLDPYYTPTQPQAPPTPLRSRIINVDQVVMEQYLECVFRGELYETLGDCVGLTREQAKGGVLHALYCDTRKWETRGNVLAERYPETAKTFKAYDEFVPGTDGGCGDVEGRRLHEAVQGHAAT